MARQRKRSVHGGGSVYQRKGDGRWVAKFKVEETGRYKELYAASEKEAYKKLQASPASAETGDACNWTTANRQAVFRLLARGCGEGVGSPQHLCELSRDCE